MDTATTIRLQPITHAHPFEVRTFRDAVGLAMELADRYEFGHAAAILERHGRVLDLTVFTDATFDSILTSLDHAHDIVFGSSRIGGGLTASMVLLSVDREDELGFSEIERSIYHWAVQTFAYGAVLVSDWIRTDGDRFHSAAYDYHPRSAWPFDPSQHRRADMKMMYEADQELDDWPDHQPDRPDPES